MQNKFTAVCFLLIIHGIIWVWLSPKLFEESLTITELNYDFVLQILDILYLPIIFLLVIAWIFVHFQLFFLIINFIRYFKISLTLI